MKWDKIEVFDLSFAAYSIDFITCKLQKLSYKNGVTRKTIGFLSTKFLYSTLLCQMCFKLSLLQVAQDSAGAGNPETTHKLTHAHAATVIHNTHKDTRVHSHSHSHHCLRRRILKVYFTKLGRGGRIFSFSPSSSRCVFERGSGAVQARSFHYHSEKALHETLPGKQGGLPS